MKALLKNIVSLEFRNNIDLIKNVRFFLGYSGWDANQLTDDLRPAGPDLIAIVRENIKNLKNG